MGERVTTGVFEITPGPWFRLLQEDEKTNSCDGKSCSGRHKPVSTPHCSLCAAQELKNSGNVPVRHCHIKKKCKCGHMFLTGRDAQKSCDMCTMCNLLSGPNQTVVSCKGCGKLSSSAAKSSKRFCTSCALRQDHTATPDQKSLTECERCNRAFLGIGPKCDLCSAVLLRCVFSCCVSCSAITMRPTRNEREKELMHTLQSYYNCSKCLPKTC